MITDRERQRGRSYLELTTQAIDGGASMIQLRDEAAGPRQLLSEARQIAQVCRARGVWFIVNDRLDLALAADADGVHLGQDDLPASDARRLLGRDKVLGISTHSLEQGLRAAEQGADYLGIGPIFGTATKATGYEPVGCEVIRQLRARIELPLIAIGGITLHNVGEVIQAGAAGAATISAIVGTHDIITTTRAFLRAIQQAEGGR